MEREHMAAVSIHSHGPTSTRIAQLSDLHCDGSEKWRRNFAAVRELLRTARVSAVLITGDCADHPKRKYYESLRDELAAMREELDVPVIAIPGNHDYYRFGTSIPLISSLFAADFRDVLGNFMAVGEEPSMGLQDLACRHRVVVYPFDSNGTATSKVLFARGRVDSPAKRFAVLRAAYKKALAERGVEWNDCIRVAILHHHPLPLPDTLQGQQMEAFHILDNANEFLRAACIEDVHLILHGHKHVSGMAEYRYVDAANSAHSVCVSACGTSAKVGAPQREVCIFDVLRSGTVTLNRVVAGVEPHFEYADNAPTRDVISYAFRRKRRADNAANWLSGQRIRQVGSKTKVVRIVDSGRAYVKITLDDIEWAQNPAPDSPVLHEYLHAGIGRVAGGWGTYRDDRGNAVGEEHRLERRQIGRDALDKFEIFRYELPEPDSGGREPSRFDLKYVVHNSYALTGRDYQESYFIAKERRCEETSTIEVLVPTEAAELIVTFPENCLPQEHLVRLDAWVMPGGSPSQSMTVVRGDYEPDADEREYLQRKGAIHYRQELNQIAAVIRHPQPGTAYTLRWALDEGATRGALHYSERFHEFRRRIENATAAQHRTIEESIEWVMQRSDIKVALFVYQPPAAERDIGRINLVQPRERAASTYMGRGLVGKALRSRQAQHYAKHQEEVPAGRRASDSSIMAYSRDDLWAEAVNCEPLEAGPCELFVIPLITPDWQSGAERPLLNQAAVAGALMISRYEEGGDQQNIFRLNIVTPEGRAAAEELVKSLGGIVQSVLK
jgi:hypothetical protein